MNASSANGYLANTWPIADVVISYHKDRSNHLDFRYIYRISYRNAKKANLGKGKLFINTIPGENVYPINIAIL